MDGWQQAIAFMRAVDERAAEEVRSYEWGRALINRRLNLVHDLNYLIADRLQGVDATTLVAAAERIQAGVGLGHRRVNVDHQAAAERLSDGFAGLGYAAERFVVMVQRRRPNRTVDTRGIREVDWAMMRPARELAVRRNAWGRNPELVQQILAKHRLTADGTKTRYFAAVIDDRVVSSCELRISGDAAQVETVETLEEFRSRGLSRAVTSAALEAASALRFIFLVTSLDDWPQQFYRRLGFDDVGIESRFVRLIG